MTNNNWSLRMLENKKIKMNIKTTKNSSQNKQIPTTSGHEKWKTPR